MDDGSPKQYNMPEDSGAASVVGPGARKEMSRHPSPPLKCETKQRSGFSETSRRTSGLRIHGTRGSYGPQLRNRLKSQKYILLLENKQNASRHKVKPPKVLAPLKSDSSQAPSEEERLYLVSLPGSCSGSTLAGGEGPAPILGTASEQHFK
ncbi:hypothetical protein NDU88_002982 [Pleurodeles waltl]|uniref:Uncharacterized protein n=1 Tax=Pleurodeles waltl TaxID=8319 RepID=A0AAV7NFI0_PLEWA|nr:hypothetical protein NDU88_002982 [Pleurodeles waltl]